MQLKIHKSAAACSFSVCRSSLPPPVCDLKTSENVDNYERLLTAINTHESFVYSHSDYFAECTII